MNRSHKILQDIFYSLHRPAQFDDNVDELGHTESDDVLTHCLAQWSDPNASLTFPSKSINVAVIYARLLEYYFKQPVTEYLSDPHLLHDDDRFFKPYPEHREEYDTMMQLITVPTILASTNPSVHKTLAYFNSEFMVGSVEFSMFTKVPRLASK